MRTEAFQVLLVAQPESEARRRPLAALRGNHPKRKAIALKYLVHGPDTLQSLPSGLMLLDFDGLFRQQRRQPIVPQPPPGLKLGDVRPLLGDADPETAA